MTSFKDILWEKQREYMGGFDNHYSWFNAFKDVFDYFEKGQAVAQIACGGIVEDLFLTLEKVGPEGRIILIDEYPAFIYERISQILDKEEGLEKLHETEEGREQLKKLFLQTNVEAYVQRLPPYPAQIEDGTLDHVMAINAALELLGDTSEGEVADVEGLIVETYRKLKKDGSLIVQGIEDNDINFFSANLYVIAERKGLNFEEDYDVLEIGHRWPGAAGYWGRWVKRE